MISSRQLEYFQAVARELHFTRAAEALRIAQPALSQQIRKLERQLGLTLFERNRHHVRITPAGHALLEHADRILSDLTAVEEEMLGWAEGTRGRIRLGTARGLATQVARVLAAFSAAYPAVTVELKEETTQDMLDDLDTGRLDAATLATRPGSGDTRLAWHPLGAEPLVLITGEGTPFAGRERLPVAELDGADLVLYPPGSMVREIVLSALVAAGAKARVRFETRDYRTARALASVGLAAAVLPRSVAEEPGMPVVIVPLDPEPSWTPSLAWSTARSPGAALAAFIAFVAEHPELAALGGDISDI
ncbi:LysR family transcriptional regulator [Nonomuraea sp. NEAU-A123]|uniref:LysR family transcriptional regulator n=1 Tax=Nonomuraea sp. NEAU-A123 TaxID=2839649 RepID=UPI001BE462B1|nr:LysR family transcriptional regulator [Nonomuraea sp. NEAU-A123]MBT2227597.1 LysR family transcriptional regulator [Nonomuraea sp. NEAU-A123]